MRLIYEDRSYNFSNFLSDQIISLFWCDFWVELIIKMKSDFLFIKIALTGVFLQLWSTIACSQPEPALGSTIGYFPEQNVVNHMEIRLGKASIHTPRDITAPQLPVIDDSGSLGDIHVLPDSEYMSIAHKLSGQAVVVVIQDDDDDDDDDEKHWHSSINTIAPITRGITSFMQVDRGCVYFVVITLDGQIRRVKFAGSVKIFLKRLLANMADRLIFTDNQTLIEVRLSPASFIGGARIEVVLVDEDREFPILINEPGGLFSDDNCQHNIETAIWECPLLRTPSTKKTPSKQDGTAANQAESSQSGAQSLSGKRYVDANRILLLESMKDTNEVFQILRQFGGLDTVDDVSLLSIETFFEYGFSKAASAFEEELVFILKTLEKIIKTLQLCPATRESGVVNVEACPTLTSIGQNLLKNEQIRYQVLLKLHHYGHQLMQYAEREHSDIAQSISSEYANIGDWVKYSAAALQSVKNNTKKGCYSISEVIYIWRTEYQKVYMEHHKAEGFPSESVSPDI